MSNHISEAELNTIKGLLHHLNSNQGLNPSEGVALDANLTDSNGESLGRIVYKHDGGYVLEFPS